MNYMEKFKAALNARVMIIDGGMGTMIEAIVLKKQITVESVLPLGHVM